jgi:hypothetical protein
MRGVACCLSVIVSSWEAQTCVRQSELPAAGDRVPAPAVGTATSRHGAGLRHLGIRANLFALALLRPRSPSCSGSKVLRVRMTPLCYLASGFSW